MKKLSVGLVLVLGLFHFPTLDAQLVESRLGLSSEAVFGWYHGPEFLSGGEDAFFPYMNTYSGGSVNAVFNINRLIGVGVNGSKLVTIRELFTEGYQQTEPDESPWRGSDMIIHSVNPFVRFNYSPWFSPMNRAVTYLQIGPTIGNAAVSMGLPPDDDRPRDAKDLFYGLTGKIGFQWPATHTLWITGSVAYQYQVVSSAVYADDRFSGTHLGLGVKINLFKNKRYIYE